MKVHYWHAYAGGNWRPVLLEHFRALEHSPVTFDEIRVGVVGPKAERARLIRALPKGVVVVASCENGYEQVTLDQLWSLTELGDLVAYSHSKGSANDHALNRRWRADLESITYGQAHRAVDYLERRIADVAAPWWLTQSITGKLPDGCAGFSPGNYWWATGSYLASLPRPHDPVNRYAAEEWVGMGYPEVAALDPIRFDPRRWA